MTKIHDKTDDPRWTSNVDDFEQAFESGDVVIAPGYGSFRTMTMVHEIDLESPHENVIHRGVFWDEAEARVYADTFKNDD